MLNRSKTDAKLGAEVENYLKEKSVHTPVVPTALTNEEKIEIISRHFNDVMNALGMDLKDDSLQDTPRRVAEMYINEMFYGLDTKNFPKCTAVENKFQYDEMVLEKNINVMSCCEHHLVGIVGKATVAYIPNKKVLGLSKLNRVVEYFCKRPQVQERLTAQIYYALSYILETEDVAVVIDSDHYCVKSRGIEDTGSSTVTSKLGGAFKADPATRAEFMQLAKRKD